MSLYQVPQEIKDTNDLDAKLDLLKNIKRSFSVYRIDAGSCNGCEIETFAAITPMWDPERFGFKLVPSPRHADILLCSGPVTRQMYYPLLRSYEATPDPKIVVALGACGISGGIFYDCYSVWSGIDRVIPVDVYIPGCPPHPASIIYGLAVGLGILDQKLIKKSYEKDTPLPSLIDKSILNNTLFERDILAHAKRLMSYLFGRKLYDKYMNAVKKSSDVYNPSITKNAIEIAMSEEEDPRYAECMGVLHNDIYLNYIPSCCEDKINTKEISWNKK